MPAAAICHMLAARTKAERMRGQGETHFGEGWTVHLRAAACGSCHDAKRSVFQCGGLFLVCELERQYQEPLLPEVGARALVCPASVKECA